MNVVLTPAAQPQKAIQEMKMHERAYGNVFAKFVGPPSKFLFVNFHDLTLFTKNDPH